MKKIYLLSLLSIFSMNLFCQIHWTKHPENPVMVPGSSGEWDAAYNSPNSVIYYDTTYHMWYSGGMDNDTSRIGHATSPDGVTWTKDTNNPVLDVDPDGDWDESAVFGGGVLVIDTIFHIWYTGHYGLVNNANFLIGHATSPDGVTWTKDTNNPVLDVGPNGTWDDTWISAGSVVYDGSEYHMWYNAWDGIDNQVRIGHATSPDGVTWAKDPTNPVLSFGAPASWDYPRIDFPAVVFDGTTYHMWYSGGDWFDWQIGYATSEDGSSWTKYANNPVLNKGSAGSWDASRVFSCSVIDSSGVKYKMWYTGVNEANGGIGYAESDTRTPYLWVKNKTIVDTTDTLVAEIDKDGIIYIVPSGTIPVIDSIIKYKVASADALAQADIQIPLTDLSIGQYTVLAVSNMGFVSTNPFFLKVVDDAIQPIIELVTETVNQGDSIIATSTKDGMLYLVNEGTPPDLSKIKNPPYLRDSLTAKANVPVEFSSSGLNDRPYLLYAVDINGIISEPETVTVQPFGTGVEENANTGISIYPNPANDLIIIETNKPGLHSIEIFSLNGQLIYNDIIEGPTHQIDLSSFQKGLYFITIRSRDFVRTEKIIKL